VLSMLTLGLGGVMSAQIWGPLKRDGCKPNGLRQFSAELLSVPQGADWQTDCRTTARNVMGGGPRNPDRCKQKKLFGLIPIEIRGEWDAPDSTCLTVPPSLPVRGETGSLVSKEPLEGFADIHVHQMADLGFGGSIVWGSAFGDPRSDLGPIPSKYKRGHDTTETAVTSHTLKTLVNTFVGDLFGHGEDGWPTFKSWPNHDMWTHQQVYEDWLFREYQGGLRLMVLLAENSEDMFGRGENHLAIIGHHKFQGSKAPGRTGNDMEALEWQVRAAYRMQQTIDQKCGGPGKGWYRIVRDPEEASEVVAQGKLAVILGAEIQHLFNCDMDRPACTNQTIEDGLNRLEAMGVNYVFPIHHKLNQFGGPATFQPLNSGPTQKCLDLSYECSSVGLTALGRLLLRELAARGMLIDTEHMSRKAFEDAMSTVEPLGYPVLAGHVVPLDLQTQSSQQRERARTSEELTRIFKVGGIVAPILGTSANEYDPPHTSSPLIPIRCSSSGGADQWANAYMHIRDLAHNADSEKQRPIPLGADWNGFAGWPGPRHDPSHSCRPRYVKHHVAIPLEANVIYPIELPRELKPAAIGGTPTLDKFEWPTGVREWDYNLVGAAHAGMVPDFIENLRLLGFTVADLEPLYRSARGVVDLWKTARRIGPSNGLHHLRWAPQSPFDVLSFDPSYWDESRNVEARTGYPLCRTRDDHKLGFVRNGSCQLVVPLNSPVGTTLQAVPISAYHAGRCLDVKDASFAEGASVVQKTCGTGSSQLWQLRSLPSGNFEILNKNSNKCLAIATRSLSGGARAVQQTCLGENQTWSLQRIGNTFRMIASNSSLCLEVPGQSRDDNINVQQSDCSGASNQLWTIDSMRITDFERLYQADKGRIMWQSMQTPDFPIVVTADGLRPICRSHGRERWIGVLTANACVGKTYDGTPATTSEFEQLYQAR
jgi:microsomal dipeptidase-like Zn-dependent dipeptidase